MVNRKKLTELLEGIYGKFMNDVMWNFLDEMEIKAGKFFEQDRKRLMPLSITCHHATTDGYHVKSFLEALQADMNDFEQYI